MAAAAAVNAHDMANDERLKVLTRTLGEIERAFGKGSVMKLGDRQSVADGVESISTGSISLDAALGIGGLPKGRVVEIYGPESSGKTTLALHAVAQAQKKGGLAAYIDAEHALDPEYAKKLGVDIDNLFISQPDSGEQALEIADQLVRSGALDIIVIDSVAALVPKAEIDGEMGDTHVGLQARLMSQALRKMTATISKTNTCVIFINQIRMKIGVMFGSPETTTGGNALKFYASVRLDVRSIQSIKGASTDPLAGSRDEDSSVVGKKTKVKVVKNKVAPPLKIATFDILYGEGISRSSELVELGTALEIVQKSGSWFSYKDSRLGQGAENVRKLLLDNPELADEIETQIRAKLGLKAKEA
ncbi:MAG TPA: recombinase RecA [Holophagaceae bacterium]|nr:recombinase RecA [Holophagaceae bacterium]